MSESKHFAGPWFIRDRVVYHKTFGEIATVWLSEYPNAGEMEANARLIAAAPELLTQLLQARTELQAYALADTGEDYNNPALNEAIAKATGEA